jgi:hypothetical protein
VRVRARTPLESQGKGSPKGRSDWEHGPGPSTAARKNPKEGQSTHRST